MVVVLTRILKGYCDLFPDLLMILNNTAKPAFKQLDINYTFYIIVLTAFRRKFSRSEYFSYYYINISNISSHLAFESLLISC